MTITTAHDQRQYPRWIITALLAGLNTLGPFSIDTYFPAFDAIGLDLQAGPIQMQQTLSVYLLGFALMLLFHGSLSDAFGRRPIILIAQVVFTLASIGCALSTSIHALIVFRFIQGLSAGAGMVVGRAIIRDLFDMVEAQKMMSQVTMIFGLAPAVAPIIGGWLYVGFGWQSVFGFMALISLVLLFASLRYLPESLPKNARQPFHIVPLTRAYRTVVLNRRFVLLSFAVGLNFAAFFLYIASAPIFVRNMLGLGPTQFAWLFLPSISGIMIGAYLSGRTAGRMRPERAVALGYAIMGGAALINLTYNHFAASLTLPWAVLPLMGYTVGMALTMPVISLFVLDLFPHLRGMAASLQGFVSTLLNSVVSGVLSPLLAVSHKTLAFGMLTLVGSGALCWFAYRRINLPRQA
jgi:DHA1 family bicyclomycin/chloramphenicol resistance-like MFS transporter